jgi:hypothetical protein
MPREDEANDSGTSSNRWQRWRLKSLLPILCLLHHPPSRMMTAEIASRVMTAVIAAARVPLTSAWRRRP